MLGFSGFAVLRERSYALYLTSRFLTMLALQMQGVAVGWQIYATTGRVADLGLVGLVQFAPFVLLILPAGQIADRHDRRRIITTCYALQLACSVLLLTLAGRSMGSVLPIFAVLGLLGCIRAFAMPAGQAIVMNLVPPEHFGAAAALNSSGMHVAMIAGPVIGGFLYLAGPQTVYATSVGALAVASLLMTRVRVRAPAVKRKPAAWRDVLEGLRFVRSKPVVLGAISLDLFAVLFGGATALLPVFAKDMLHAGPETLGLLRMAPAVGAAATAIALAGFPITRHVGRWMFGGVALFGVATIVFGVSVSLPLSVAALVLAGAGDMVSMYIRHILVQFETPDAIRGRVSAVNAMFIGASNELGEFESGITAHLMGLVPAVVVGGIATLGVAAGWMARFPMLRDMDRFPHAQDALDAAPGEAAAALSERDGTPAPDAPGAAVTSVSYSKKE